MNGLNFITEGKRVWIEGNSYPYKQAIRNAGGHWDPETRRWWVGTAKLEELQASLSESDPTVGYAKIGEAWGVRGVGAPPVIGAKVRAVAKSGRESEETITEVVTHDDQGWTALIAAKAFPAKKAGSGYKPSKCGNCGGTAGRRGQYGKYEGGTCSCCRPNCSCYDCRS